MKVVIMCPTLIKGDAVGHDVIEQYECLKEEGIEAFIYAENHDLSTSNLITNRSIDLLKDKDTILIYHHAIYWERGIELLKNANCKKVVRYHNITPPHFFLPYSSEHYKSCLLGRIQNYEIIATDIDMIFSNSTFSAKDFLDIGFPEDKIRILPPFHRIHDFDNIKGDPMILDKLMDGKINVLFVGRVAPNKGHKHILYTAFFYKLMFGNNVRFVIVGGVDPLLIKYCEELTNLVDFLKIHDIIEFTGKVSFQHLKSYYLGAHIFLLLSEHEGFCVPILESQYFNVPIIAYNSSAIKETIGSNQLIYDTLCYEVLASAIYTIYHDADARMYLVREGYKNFLKYERANLKSKFLLYLRELE